MAVLDFLFLIIIILLPFWYFSKNRKQRRRIIEALEKFKGDPWYPILGTAWSQVFVRKEDLFDQMYNRPEKYGPIYRSWVGSEPLIHLTKAKHAEILLKSSVNIKKGKNYEFVRSFLGDGLITGHGEQWQRHRKLITPAFHFKILDGFQDIFSEKSQMLVEELQPLADGKFFDIYSHITHCALDIICETAMGVKINAMQCFDSEYIKAIYRIAEIILYRWFRPWLHSDFIFKHSPVGKEHDKLIRIVHDFVESVIEDRKKELENSKGITEVSEEDRLLGKKKKMAFLDLLLLQNVGKNELSDKEIREEVDTFMFAGHDTTTSSVCWTLFSLGNYPEIQEKIHEEIDSIFHGEDRPFTPDDVAKLQYTERVIKETLRLYAVVPYILRYLVEDIELEGVTIPAGVTVAIHITNLHKDPEQFPDPHRFDPDRFLPENVSKRNPYSHIPFSAGPRNCLGQKFASRSAKTMVASILRKYKVKSQVKPSEMKYFGTMLLKPQGGLRISLEPRV
ncbi:hypothetical protein HHI36_000003 [Cryptolaemus montrouzieri]|uniref:Cytochrome P450 n=1 Tax=Cryptolaemus montrouzieri TaxID=559131 RepID=A0ABD2P3J1_9CUCU